MSRVGLTAESAGLLELAYEMCLCHELSIRGLNFARQVPIPVEYKGVKLDCGNGIRRRVLHLVEEIGI